MSRKRIIASVIGVILLGASFYGGVVYGKSEARPRGQFGTVQFMGGGMRGGVGGGFTSGEILSKDQTGITLKLQDGSTKIVLIGASTQVMKEASSTMDDLSGGEQVTVIGTANADGSITARTVQVR